MITVFEGRMGSGLTTALLYFLDKERLNGKEIIVSGFDEDIMSTLKGCIQFELKDFKSYFDKNNVAFFLDETYGWWDCRMSASSRNKVFTYLAHQHEKNNFHFYISTRSVSMVDKRIRYMKELILGSCFSSKKKRKVYVDFGATLDRTDDPKIFSEPKVAEGETFKIMLEKTINGEYKYEFDRFLLPEMDFDDILEIDAPDIWRKTVGSWT